MIKMTQTNASFAERPSFKVVIADAARRLAALISLCVLASFAASMVASDYAIADDENFALLADTHLGQPGYHAYEDAEQALLWASELDGLAAVCVAGDITDRGDAVSYSEWDFLCASIVPGAARIQALGDHDTGKNGEYLKADKTLTVANGLKYFKQINNGTITSYREFERANVMTVGGVSARGHSVITNSMLKQLNKRLLKTVRQGKMAIVISHYPHDSSSLNKRAKFMGILRSYPNVIYVAGDRHKYSTNRQCQVIRPACSTTPYARTGFKRSTKYGLRSIGVNACCGYRSGKYTYADSLSISDSGSMRLSKWNITKDVVDKIWRFNQKKSAVIVKCPALPKKSSRKRVVCKITFSDGGTYGGVASGETFSMKPKSSKRFSKIPAGVLVTVKVVKGPVRWKKAKLRKLEVGASPKAIRI